MTMFVQLSLLHFIFLLLPPAFSYSISKLGCPDRCGDLLIPFPIGVGSDCSLAPSFNIICNTSTDPPKAYVKTHIGRILEVVEINASQGRVRRPYLLNVACYDNSSKLLNSSKGGYWFGLTLNGTQFTLSEENWLTAIGCDDMVLGIGLGNTTFGGGCASFCENTRDYGDVGFCPDNANGYSPSNGCCRTPIPRGLSYVGAQFIDISKRWRTKKLFRCSYAFVQENQSNYSYPLFYLDHRKKFRNYRLRSTSRLPVFRLDWRIGMEICSQALRNTSTYACQDNTACVDIDFDGGTQGCHCRCLEGYQGNAYLSPGCQDINECMAKPCYPKSVCINTPASYNCSCQEGYYGDRRLNGTGCIQLPNSKNINLTLGLGSGIGCPLVLIMCFWLHKFLKKRNEKMRNDRFFKQNGGLLLQQKTNEGTIRKTKHFPAKELEKATDNFNESRVLGQGGQGTVYKGMLSEGKIVAVKKSKQVDEDQLEQFINEIVILSQVDHRNVVKLLGCSLETKVPLLVYEFIPNGTLFNLIHDPNTQFPLSWDMRLKIAADIAGAIAYLHSASSFPIYHRDIKSSNFLLDEKYVVKVADFGISRSVAEDQTHVTTMVKGTFGYFDPAYFQSHHYTENSDVYSFGVVLAELLTGKRPTFYERSEEMQKSLASHFLASVEENKLDVILDPQVSEGGRKEEVISVARLAQRCLNLKRDVRPTMKEVAIELEGLRISRQPATFNDELEEANIHQLNPNVISNIQYAWTTGCINDSSTISSVIHPCRSKSART